jgi:hypothetical protein
MGYLRSTVGICTGVNMTLMSKDRIIMIIIIILEYAKFIQL